MAANIVLPTLLATTSGASSLIQYTQDGTRPNQFYVIWIIHNTPSAVFTGVTIPGSTGLAFRSLGRAVGATRTLECVVAWGLSSNIGSQPVTVTVSVSEAFQFHIVPVDAQAPQTSDITGVFVSSVGTGTTVDPTTITPSDGDVLLTAGAWASTTASTTSTDTPGGVDSLAISAVQSGTENRMESTHRLRPRSVAHKRVWTLATSTEFAAAAVSITPVPPVVLTSAALYKGRDTKTLDEGAVA